MELLARHLVLVAAENREKGKAHVLDFFGQTALVRYDRIEIIDNLIFCGTDSAFSEYLEDALRKNKQVLAGFIDELDSAGFDKRTDLANLHQGYPSKVLHIIAHFLDGFIGIDSPFYNLIDDSHWLADETSARIEKTPEHFWLFALDGYAMSPKEAAIIKH